MDAQSPSVHSTDREKPLASIAAGPAHTAYSVFGKIHQLRERDIEKERGEGGVAPDSTERGIRIAWVSRSRSATEHLGTCRRWRV